MLSGGGVFCLLGVIYLFRKPKYLNEFIRPDRDLFNFLRFYILGSFFMVSAISLLYYFIPVGFVYFFLKNYADSGKKKNFRVSFMANFVFKWFDYLLSWVFFARKKTFVKKKPRVILCIKLAAMGDALLLMPALRHVKNNFKNSRLILVTTSRINPSLFSKMEFLDDIIILDKSPKFIIKMVFSYFFGKKVDVAIDFDQYYSVSELLSTFAENSFGYRTNLKGKKLLKNNKL